MYMYMYMYAKDLRPTDRSKEWMYHCSLKHALGVFMSVDGGIGLQAVSKSLHVLLAQGFLKQVFQSRLQS